MAKYSAMMKKNILFTGYRTIGNINKEDFSMKKSAFAFLLVLVMVNLNIYAADDYQL